MNRLLLTGSAIVLLALAAYSVAIIPRIRRPKASTSMFHALALGVFLDATATGFMIAGSSKGLFTLHGIIGYIAFCLMLLDLILVARFRKAQAAGASLPTALHHYSVFAYGWWVLTFIAGGILASGMLKAH
jgi:hypothetical protein